MTVAQFVVRQTGKSTNMQMREKRWALIACNLQGQVRGFYMRNRGKYLTSKGEERKYEKVKVPVTDQHGGEGKGDQCSK